ncbi:hypothetical protein [Salmonirosea aquatica]|uniref:ASCH domain-containing protein n=1 Tax=Salmonirosea aquatica TaxID=2654236 RepID=A0A7C9BM71_9BACT|nr:hypothetical protein [Cytophagaceae bacterium SJW1-29]MPR37137.1 hypothetical protein [Cytophagaceae bacterium SJW1-29]
MQYERLDFSYNWNNKLDCKAFTTLRLLNPKRYFIGAKFEVFYKNKTYGIFEVKKLTPLTPEGITDLIAYLDTGYNANECRDVLRTMYKNKPNFNDSTPLAYCLLVQVVKPEVSPKNQVPLFN